MQIDYIFVHTEGSPDGSHGTRESVDRYHRSLGWSGIGYHFFIDRGGVVRAGRPLSVQGAHVYGVNDRSLGVCVSGNGDMMPFNAAQWSSLVSLLAKLQKAYPKARILGHREVNRLVNAGLVPEFVGGKQVRTPKSCPGTRVNMDAVRRAVQRKMAPMHSPMSVASAALESEIPVRKIVEGAGEVIKRGPAIIRALKALVRAVRG